jgi:hypothetical protein
MERELLDPAQRILIGASLLTALLFAQAPSAPPAAEQPKPAQEPSRRIELNLLGRTDTDAGESRRNENIQFNLVDNNALKELNVRLGTTATIVEEFRPERNYFWVEFGNSPSPVVHAQPVSSPAFHGSLYWSHLNSVLTARSFFPVGDVLPARENDYGANAGWAIRPGWHVQVEGSQQKLRGNVNGNVLVPKPDERTPLATDPAVRALIGRWLAAFPAVLPNRTDINERALNTNAAQTIDNHNASARLDAPGPGRGRLRTLYAHTSQYVDAFQLVAGQNPDTATRSHRARLTWYREFGSTTLFEATAGFDRVGSLLVSEPNAVGPMVSISGLTTLGPQGNIPINRAQNLFRWGGTVRQTRGAHRWTAGIELLRRQFNGIESDANRGFYSFANDFGRDGITNFRLGVLAQHIVTLGDMHRGFRSWESQFYAGDTWRVRPRVNVSLGVRYTPVTRPVEVNGLNAIPYDCDCNNVAPQLGFAVDLPRSLGIARASYALHYGEIFPVTFSQVRFSPPNGVKLVVIAPDLLDPRGAPGQSGTRPRELGNLYLLDPELASPYSHQYNLSWEPRFSGTWRVQLGYVGSRSHKLLLMWYLNRAHAVPGLAQVTATINDRRPDPGNAETRWVLNGSRGYYDAARATLVVPRWRGLSIDASYWFSKALDLGSSYTNTAYDNDSRLSRSQSEFSQHGDMKGLSPFDQTHAVLWRASFDVPRWASSSWASRIWSGWSLGAVVLLKSGTPFTVSTGSDGPGFGNVDGNGGDRPNLVDLSVLGRTIGDPDNSRALLPRVAFGYPGPLEEFGGNLGRNTFRKGGIRNVNASIRRSFVLRGEKRLTVRAESINLGNTPQFAEPGAELTNPNFGAITNTLNDGRTVRVAVQLGW